MKNKHTDKQSNRQKAALFLIASLGGLTAAGLLMHGPIPQDLLYHDFGDQRTLFNVPNFWNVISNLPFIIVGMIGLYRCKNKIDWRGPTGAGLYYTVFFSGVLLTGLGSSYYHLQPDNWGLFWDRLSMVLSFMAFFSIIISSYISPKAGFHLLTPFILFGILSTVYWIITEQQGMGDLRLYAVTQYLPMLIIPIIILVWKSSTIKTSDIIIIGSGYGLAKVFEALDSSLYQTFLVSGHSLKHLAAALSAYWLLIILNRNQYHAVLNHKPIHKELSS